MCFNTGNKYRKTEAWLAELARRRYSGKSIDTYRYALGNMLSFFQPPSGLSVNFQDITSDDIEAWRMDLVRRGLAPASQEVFLRAARLFFNWLEKTGQLFINPCSGLVVRQPPRSLPVVPTEDDIIKLLASVNVSTKKGIRDRALIETAYTCGARREELVRMTIFDPDIKAGTVRLKGKGNKERIVPLGTSACRWLGEYLSNARGKLLAGRIDQHALWIGGEGAPWNGQCMNLQVKTRARAVGTSVPVTLHSLRRACATHMLQRGAHPLRIQMLLGHATMRHLGRYLRLSITDIKQMHQQSKPGG